MTEKSLLNKIQLSLPNFFRLFRNNTGRGWVGKTNHKNGNVFIENARPLNAGLTKGSSDLIGWTSIEITPDMVGKKVAIFTAIEAKTGRQKPKKEPVWPIFDPSYYSK